MENRLLNMIQLLELQLVKTDLADAWLRRIWQDKMFCQALGIPTVVCGPGSMDQGHKPDEFVEAAQLAQCEVMMQRLVALLAEQPVSSQAD